jgi:hypothetical protein
MSTLHSDMEFLPSTLEHRPLKDVEKTMLLQHFGTTGAQDLETLEHWAQADREDLRLLEAWVWGMRYWGRETLFRVALYGFMLCKSLWDKGDQGGNKHQVSTVKMGQGGSLQEMLDACLRWAKLPGEEAAKAILALRGENPELWIAREVPVEDRRSVFACTLIGCDRMAAAVLLPRDQAARMAGQAMVCGALALEAIGHSPEQATRLARGYLVREMRTWFGRKW